MANVWRLRNVLVGALLITGCSDDGGGSDGDTAAGSTGGNADTTAVDTAGDDGVLTDEGGQTDEGSSDDGSVTTGDPDGGSSGSTDEDGGSTDTGGGMAIPPPGTGENWISEGDISTPGNAWPVGVQTTPFPYVEGTTGEDGLGFFVFEAGLDNITINATPNDSGVVTDIHIHDGTGLVFGDEIPPNGRNDWTLVPGNIYVVELVYPGAGFF